MPNVARKHKERHDLSEEEIGGLAPEAEPIVLTARDWEAFLVEWDNPQPRPRLEEAVRRYRSRRQPDAG
jgi:hypothetical protein